MLGPTGQAASDDPIGPAYRFTYANGSTLVVERGLYDRETIATLLSIQDGCTLVAVEELP